MRNNYTHITNYLLVFIIAFLFCPKPAVSQEKEAPVKFSGRNVTSGQYSNRQGAFSDVPKSFLRNDLHMNLSIYDVPIITNFFITTEQNDYKQSIDNLRFYIDLNTVKKNRAKIESRNKKLKQEDVKAPWMLRFLSNFSRIEAGKVRPVYSKLTLQGVALSGVNIEFTKFVYAAFATGRLSKVSKNKDIYDTTYTRKLVFGKFGYGEKRRTHFYLTYMYSADETENARLPDPWNDTLVSLRPQSNSVFGAELRLSFIKNKWVIDGEAGLSFLTRDDMSTIEFPPEIEEEFDKYPQFIINMVDPNFTTSVDYAYRVSTSLNLKTTTITGGYSFIGPGYTTFGNPNLVTDRQTIEGRINQAFYRRRITLSLFYKQNKDNILNWKINTSTNTLYGGTLRFTFPKIPYFQISYTPNIQEITGITNSKNTLKIITASTGYSYPIGTLRSFTSFSYLYQDSENMGRTIKSSHKNRIYTINQVLKFKTPTSINLNINFNKATIVHDSLEKIRKTTNVALSITNQSFKKRWKNTLGARFMQIKSEYNQRKLSLFLNTNFQLWKKGSIGLILEENIFRSDYGLAADSGTEKTRDFNELIARCKLTVGW